MNHYVICNSFDNMYVECQSCPHSVPHKAVHYHYANETCTNRSWDGNRCNRHIDGHRPQSIMTQCIPYNPDKDMDLEYHYAKLLEMYNDDKA